MRPTIKDVAALAGTSTATVSRVINNRGTVAPGSRRKVEEVLEKLDYYPDASARNLARCKSNSIMFLVTDISMTYYAELAKAMSHVCRRSDLRVLLGDLDSNVKMEAHYLETLKGNIADGVIATPIMRTTNIKLYLDLMRRGVPVVLIDSYIEGLPISYVVVDNVQGGYEATMHLCDRGHKRIAFISGDMDMQTNRHRYEGYLRALREKGLLPRPEYSKVGSVPIMEGAVRSVEELLALPEPPTAIFAANDTAAIACMPVLRRKGLRIPDDIAIVGFDDLHESAFLDVPLTTVAQPIAEIAEKAVEILLQQANQEPEDRTTIQHCITPKLIVRESA